MMIEAFESLQAAAGAAQEALAAGDLARAEDTFLRIAQQFKGKRQAIVLAAEGLRKCGRSDRAIALLEAELARHPLSPAVLLALSEAHFELNDFPRAAAYVERHLARDPSSPKVWSLLGECRRRAKDWAAAETAFARALALDPGEVEALLARGDVLFSLGRNDDAVASYREANAIRPNDAIVLFKLGSALIQIQELAEAEALLRQAVALSPQHAAAHVNLATTLHQAGRSTEAEQAAREAVALDPTMSLAHATLGTILVEQSRYADAERALRRADELQPNNVLTLTALASAQTALGLFLDAQRSWLNVLDVEPGNLEARHMLAALTNEPVRTVPEGYSAQLFDWFAPRYDRLLSGPLDYRGAQETLSLLREIEPDRDAFHSFADLGCGTGVVGESVGEYYRIDREVGVDVSRKMIEVARSKGVYDEFIHGDAQGFLAAHPGSFDLITAVDLFINIGELETLIPAIAGGVKPGGIVMYTIETLASGTYKLMSTGRFAHAVTYIEDLARGAGLVPLKAKPVTLRFEKSRPVPAIVGALRRLPT